MKLVKLVNTQLQGREMATKGESGEKIVNEGKNQKNGSNSVKKGGW